MPITIHPSSHPSSPIPHGSPVTSPLDHLTRACRKESEHCQVLLQSAFDSNLAKTRTIYPSHNGFVHAAIQAYNNHHHLTIRPDDLWLAILSQLSLWINAHAEEVRGLFVAHKGKKELEVVFREEIGYSIDWGLFAQKICDLIEVNVVDGELRAWMMPAFSTSEEIDRVVACVLMMGSMQKYFGYKCRILCGLPSVTLLGERSDWELILRRLEKLATWGEEPELFGRLLRPVVDRFIRSFEEPDGDEVLGFWARIAHFVAGGSGPSYYSGWITAFCFWDETGKCMFRAPPQLISNDYDDPDLDGPGPIIDWSQKKPVKKAWDDRKRLNLDGVDYHWVESDNVPPGYTSVPMKVDDNGHQFEAMIVAGSVGIKATGSEREEREELDTMSPTSGWWIFQKKKVGEVIEDKYSMFG